MLIHLEIRCTVEPSHRREAWLMGRSAYKGALEVNFQHPNGTPEIRHFKEGEMGWEEMITGHVHTGTFLYPVEFVIVGFE